MEKLYRLTKVEHDSWSGADTTYVFHEKLNAAVDDKKATNAKLNKPIVPDFYIVAEDIIEGYKDDTGQFFRGKVVG